jgi:2-amino-4-hydroxy-6-hydroxymethyldihydropteridine diphosphokinase
VETAVSTEAFVGLGSNVGNRLAMLRLGVSGLARAGMVAAVSSLYETAPVGGPEQGPFLNAVALVDTDLDPDAMFDVMIEIERGAGRERLVRWGPRTLDLDLLVFGELTIRSDRLEVPHPRLAERRFVLEPLAELRPDLMLPEGSSVGELMTGVTDQPVRRIRGPGWHL